MRALIVCMRALRRVFAGRRLSLRNLYIEADGQILGRIAGSVIACLVLQSSADNVFAGLHGTQWPNKDTDFEVPRVNVELLVGGEGKAHILTVRVGSLADYDVGGGLHF